MGSPGSFPHRPPPHPRSSRPLKSVVNRGYAATANLFRERSWPATLTCHDPRVEILEAIDNLDDLLHRAKPRPLDRSQVRIDRDAYTAAVARLRAAIQTDLPDVVAPAVAEPIGLLERRAAAADGGRITLERDKVYDELDLARAVVVEDIRRQRDG